MGKQRKQPEEKQGLPEWMGTYGDMVTLLLCFFVLLFSMADVDAQKFQAIFESFGVMEGNVGVLEGGVKITSGIKQLDTLKTIQDKTQESKGKKRSDELNEIKEKLEEFVKNNKLQDKMEIKQTENSVDINFVDNVLFDSAKADLKKDAIKILDKVYEEIRMFPENHVKVEGHTDNVPIYSSRFRNNWELSAIRAISVTTYFVNTKKHNPRKISAEGYGEYYPVDTNKTARGRQKNRRVEIKIMSQYNDKI